MRFQQILAVEFRDCNSEQDKWAQQKIVEATSGAAFSQLMFDHWALLDGGDFSDPETRLGKVVHAIRARKGLEPQMPPLDRYLDKL